MKTTPRNALLLCLLFAPLAHAASDTAPSKDAPADPQQQVIVEASRASLVKLAQDVLMAEARFYQRYNEINTKREYKVVCTNEATTGSRFKKQYCQPVYQSNAQAAEAQQFIRYLGSSSAQDPNGGVSQSTGAPPSAITAGTVSSASTVSAAASGGLPSPATMGIESGRPAFQQNVIEVARKSPELMKLLREHAALAQRYEDTFRKVNHMDPRDGEPAASAKPAAPSE